jgi:hypothetical protein
LLLVFQLTAAGHHWAAIREFDGSWVLFDSEKPLPKVLGGEEEVVTMFLALICPVAILLGRTSGRWGRSVAHIKTGVKRTIDR